MSGLAELGGLNGFVAGGMQVSQKDIDQYEYISINNPSVDNNWYGTLASASNPGTLVRVNQMADWPRNLCYTFTGTASGTFGGTLTANYLDQFGVAGQEKVVVTPAVNGGTVYGTAIVAQFLSGSYSAPAAGTVSTGTVCIGNGTSASGNWFGLTSKIGGTADINFIRWTKNGTPTTLNGGTNIGTLISVANHAFQGTSGVAITDTYTVNFKPSYDNAGKGTMSNL
jgi:hypothetical protein